MDPPAAMAFESARSLASKLDAPVAVQAATRVLSPTLYSTKQDGEDSRSELSTSKSDAPSGRRVAHVTLVATEKNRSKKAAGGSVLKTPSIIKSSLPQITEDASFRADEPGDLNDKEPSLVSTEQGDESSFSFISTRSARSAVTFGNVEVREDSLIRGAISDSVEEYEAKRRPKPTEPARSMPKDAPTKKSLTYETIRVQATTATPKSRQVAHEPPHQTAESLYGDFEDKFQSRRTKKKGGFFGFFRRKSSKKRNMLEHM